MNPYYRRGQDPAGNPKSNILKCKLFNFGSPILSIRNMGAARRVWGFWFVLHRGIISSRTFLLVPIVMDIQGIYRANGGSRYTSPKP